MPYYNKPTQEGLYRHFRKIAETVDLPMILYNVPGRTVADLQNDTVLRLAQVPGIIGIKDATANIERGTDLVQARAARLRHLQRRRRHRARADPARRARRDLGHRQRRAALMHEMCAAALVGDVKKARELNLKLLGAAPEAVRRGQPDPGEMGAGADGPHRGRACACR